MSTTASAIIGSIFGFIISFIILLTLRIAEMRERIARLETRVEDYRNGLRHRRRDGDDDEH